MSDNIKTLKGLIPVCAWCRKARSDKGYWDDLENYSGIISMLILPMEYALNVWKKPPLN